VGAGAVEVWSPCSYPSSAITAKAFLPNGPLAEGLPHLPVVDVHCKCIASLLVQMLISSKGTSGMNLRVILLWQVGKLS
jgi:hypothetical protein